MSLLSLLVYVGDAWIIGAYGLLAFGKIKIRPFHWANAGAGVPTITFEVLVHAWPVMPLTVTFCVVGWIGVWRTRHDNNRQRCWSGPRRVVHQQSECDAYVDSAQD